MSRQYFSWEQAIQKTRTLEHPSVPLYIVLMHRHAHPCSDTALVKLGAVALCLIGRWAHRFPLPHVAVRRAIFNNLRAVLEGEEKASCPTGTHWAL